MKKIVFLCLLFISLPSFALDLAKYPTFLSSDDGVQVIIAPTVNKKHALVKVTGVNSPIDGVVLLTDLVSRSNGKKYQYTFDGSKRSLILVSDDYGCCSYNLYLPDVGGDGIYLAKEKTPQGDVVATLSALYEQQQQKGVQDKLAAFNREKHVQAQEKKIADANQTVLKQCGVEIPTQVDWAQVSDADLGRYAVGAYCAQVASELANQCSNKPEVKKIAQGYKAIHCSFTDELKIREKDHILYFKTAPKAPNQGQFIQAYFDNL